MKYLLLLALAVFSMVGRVADASPCQSPGQNETVMGAGAQGLGPGQWCELTNAQPPGAFLGTTSDSGEPNNLFEYAHGGQWDPVNGLFVIVGYGYGPASVIRCATIVYKKATNEWMTFDSEPVSCTGNGHAYDQTVVDPVTGYVYFTPRLSNSVYRGIWNDSTEKYSWSSSAVSRIDQGCVDTGGEEAMGLAWDASRNGIVLFTDAGGGTACFWDESTNTWSEDNGSLRVDGSFHHVGEYNPVRQVTWMQDYGTRIHYRNDGGSVTALSTSNPPFTLGCCGSGGRHSTADPASGKFIVVNADFSDPGNNQWYEYEINNDSWSPINQSMPPFYAEGAAAPISDHGVIMYVDYKFGTSKVYLYKHEIVVAPMPPSDLQAN
jgi:hypothetical protein